MSDSNENHAQATATSIRHEKADGIALHEKAAPATTFPDYVHLEVIKLEAFQERISEAFPKPFHESGVKERYADRFVPANMKENDRIVIYDEYYDGENFSFSGGGKKRCVFRGSVDENGDMVLKEILDLTPLANDRLPASAGLQDMVTKVFDDDLRFRFMNQPIAVPAKTLEFAAAFFRSSGDRASMSDQDARQAFRPLQENLTLHRLATQAMSDQTPGSNANLAKRPAEVGQAIQQRK